MKNEEKEAIRRTAAYVKETLENESSGHDWHHIERVRKMSKKIAEKEGGNLFIIDLAALLHDIADWKFHKGDDTKNRKVAENWLRSLGLDDPVVNNVVHIVDNVSFKGAGVENEMKTLEGKIVQDADRLDAIGAIGIARCFAYGGKTGKPLFDASIKPSFHKSFEEYKLEAKTSINHFYEKLLLLKDRMNTKTAKKIAERRHKFIKDFLNEFLKEWYGKI